MESHTEEAVPNVNSEVDVETTPSLKDYVQKAIQKIIDVSSSSEEDDTEELEDVDGQSQENSNNQLVVYDPRGNNNNNREIEPKPAPIQCRNPTVMRCISRAMSRVLPSVGAFTVQCANCFKWRLIPTQEKYEEIREHILERPFYCEAAQEWRPTVSCDDPEDISQDGSRLWAIDKPNIAQPPRGWQRLLHIRGEGCSKFADVYYAAPSGKRLRSIVEIQKYLADHPEYAEGISLSQFSFQTPKPLQENYVRKRPPRITAQADNSRLMQPKEVTPLSIVGPDNINLELGMPSSVSVQEPASDDVGQPANKKARTEWKDMYCDESTAYKQRQAMVGEASQSVNEGLSL